MKIFASKRVAKKLRMSNDREFDKKLQQGVECIQKAFKNSKEPHNPQIHKLKVGNEFIFSYRIDDEQQLLFTFIEDSDKILTITLLDIANIGKKTT
jgi:hypothetical protein